MLKANMLRAVQDEKDKVDSSEISVFRYGEGSTAGLDPKVHNQMKLWELSCLQEVLNELNGCALDTAFAVDFAGGNCPDLLLKYAWKDVD